MESPFHVIHEYEILKKILSNLNCRDLLTASRVCQNWKKVSDIIIQKNLKVLCYLKLGDKWPPFDEKVLPKLVIYSNNEEKQIVPKVLKRYLNNLRDSKDFYCLLVMNWRFIHSLQQGSNYTVYHSSLDERDKSANNFNESLLVIPDFKHLELSVERIDLRKLKTDLKMTVETMKSAKSHIVIVECNLHNRLNGLKALCDALESDGKDVVLAGGVAQCLKHQDVSLGSNEVVVISFSGDSLTSMSFVIPYNVDVPESFSKMSEVLGPVEAGYERMAFVFTCVDRYLSLREEELTEFSKVFPNIRLNGYWSLGELCLGYPPLLNDFRLSKSTSSIVKPFRR